MHNNRKTSVSSSGGNPDDGSGSKQVWRVKSFELVPVPEESHGVFYSGDCYVVLYTYLKNTKEYHIVYFWLVSQYFLFLLSKWIPWILLDTPILLLVVCLIRLSGLANESCPVCPMHRPPSHTASIIVINLIEFDWLLVAREMTAQVMSKEQLQQLQFNLMTSLKVNQFRSEFAKERSLIISFRFSIVNSLSTR